MLVIIMFIKPRGVTFSKGDDMIFERSLVLEIRTTNAKPELSAVLLVGSPVTFDGQQLATLATCEGFHAMLPFVVSLQSGHPTPSVVRF